MLVFGIITQFINTKWQRLDLNQLAGVLTLHLYSNRLESLKCKSCLLFTSCLKMDKSEKD